MGLLALCVGLFGFGHVVEARPVQQALATDPIHLYLLPLTDTSVRLLTHTFDVEVRIENEQTVFLVNAGYRLHNTAQESQTLLLQVIQSPAQTTQGLPEGVSLTVDGQPLSLQPVGSGYPQTSQVTIAADGRRLLTLSYQVRSNTVDLGAFRYTPRLLDPWAGRPESWRITLNLPGETSGLLPAESWVTISPDSWTYNGRKLQWLQEGAFPEQPIVLQWIAPTLWRSLAETRQLLNTEPTLERFLTLGDRYNRLYRAPQIEDGARQRFYAQALAAYSDGIVYAQQVGLPSTEFAALHRALATLYRSRSISSNGQIDHAYIDLMVQEIERALTTLPQDDGRRTELTQWLAQGLETQLRQAQQQANWSQAATVLEQMAVLPNFDAAWIASERQLIELQQALTLLNQDNQDAAVALAGAAVLDESLLPPPENRALFAGWQVTLTLGIDENALQLVASPVDGREDTARLVADQLEQAWQNAGATGAQVLFLVDGRLSINLSAQALTEGRLVLARAVPPLTDWALLRTLLASLDPSVNRSNQWIWDRVEIAQYIDLRAASDQWRGVAALLERQAADIQLVSASTGTQSVDAVQTEIRTQLRQIYLTSEAQIWQNAVRGSTIRVEVVVGAESEPARVWVVQMSDAPQTLSFQTEVLSGPRLLLAVLTVLVLMLAIAGLLWLLL